MATREKARFGKVMLTGVPKGAVGSDTKVYLENELGQAVLAAGTTVPIDGTTGYCKGCTFIDTNLAGACVYFNKGDETSSLFSLVTQA